MGRLDLRLMGQCQHQPTFGHEQYLTLLDAAGYRLVHGIFSQLCYRLKLFAEIIGETHIHVPIVDYHLGFEPGDEKLLEAAVVRLLGEREKSDNEN